VSLAHVFRPDLPLNSISHFIPHSIPIVFGVDDDICFREFAGTAHSSAGRKRIQDAKAKGNSRDVCVGAIIGHINAARAFKQASATGCLGSEYGKSGGNTRSLCCPINYGSALSEKVTTV